MNAGAPPAQTATPPWPPALTSTAWCPLCGTALHEEQDWCLRCGAAARTRLAVTPRWRVPVLALTTLVSLSLIVLVAALVKLIG